MLASSLLVGIMSSGVLTQLPAVANLAARWSADAITPQADSTNVTSWTDSVNGYAASQAASANQPLYRTNRMGGKPSVQFTGSKWLAATASGLKAVCDSQLYTVMFVISNPATVSNGVIFGNAAGGSATAFMYQVTGTTVGRYDNTTTAKSVPWSSAGFMTFGHSTQPTKRYTVQSGTGLERMYARGTCVGCSEGPGAPTSSSSGAFAIGARDDTGAFSAKCDLYEIIVWNKVLSELEWLQAEAWACAKYGQAVPWAGLSSLDVYDGDSLTRGVSSVVSDITKEYPYQTATARSRTYGQWTVQATGGIQWTVMNGKISEWSGMGAYMGVPMNVIAFEWYNEFIGGGYSGAAAWAKAATYAANVKAISGTTKLCLLSSTGFSGDASAQPYATVRKPYNDQCDANAAAVCDVYGALHADATYGPLIGDGNSYTNNTGLWAPDGIHFALGGYADLSAYATIKMNAMRA